MIESDRVLQPLDEARDAFRALTEYEDAAQLAVAISAAWQAVDRALRLLLRSDPDAPDRVRLAAFSPTDLPTDSLLQALRERDLISLELAGRVHELARAAERVRGGDVRAADADAAVAVEQQLRAEVSALAERPVREVAEQLVETRALDETPRPVPVRARRGGRLFTVLGVTLALLVLAALALTLVLSLREQREDAFAAFRAGRMAEAESAFKAMVVDEPENATAWLYLGRIHRRQERYREAADALRRAQRLDPRDPDVERELGYLFLALDRPESAAASFRRAVELQPEERNNWIGLVLALRAAGDPGADSVLAEAPPEARALLSR